MQVIIGRVDAPRIDIALMSLAFSSRRLHVAVGIFTAAIPVVISQRPRRHGAPLVSTGPE